PSVVLVMAAPTVAFAVFGIVRAHRDGVLKRWLSVRSGDFSRGFAAAAVLFGGGYAFTKVVTPPLSPRMAWVSNLYFQIDAGDPSTLRKNVGTVVFTIIVMGFAEE